ncbi:MAG: hypothetical protein ISS25_01415 [Nanoarchaeota archaeon]|nr:hypothetical protein [DPANN group archaeon]MBL7116472.1 hypothetical protein [Nanoarchaeota archaeon]
MENLPPLPSLDNKMEITNLVEFEVFSEGQKYLFVFVVNIDVTFDSQANEIVIDCTEERLDIN